MIVEIILALSVVLNAALGYGIWNLMKTNEEFEDYFRDLQGALQHVLRQISVVDASGAFEADDEVGSAFKTIQGMIESLRQFLVDLDAKT